MPQRTGFHEDTPRVLSFTCLKNRHFLLLGVQNVSLSYVAVLRNQEPEKSKQLLYGSTNAVVTHGLCSRLPE